MNDNRKTTYLWGGAMLILTGVAAFALGRGTVPDAGGSTGERGSAQVGMDMSDQPAMASDSGMTGMVSEGTIRLTPGEIGTFGITFGSADVRPLVKTIRAVGLVEFDETRLAFVAPKFSGWVERLEVNFTGQPVRRGEPLLEVYSPELVSAQEDLLLAARLASSVEESSVAGVVGGARDLLASARRRLRYWDVSEEQIERLLESGEVRKTLTLFSPVSGVVMEKGVFEGQAFQAGDNLYMIADLSSVWVNAEIFEADAALAREGMGAAVTMAALPGRTFAGQVEYVYPTLQERTRSIRARVSIANPRGEIKPGMYSTVALVSDLGESLTVPTSAVLYSGERAVAFVDTGDGVIVPHELVLGTQGRDHVQVLSGLAAGQRIVTSAQFLLDSESNLAEVMRAMMAQMNVSDMGVMDTGGMGMGGGAATGMDGAEPMTMPDTAGGR
jgi:membrane fusion protein, copper/silver efflux system